MGEAGQPPPVANLPILGPRGQRGRQGLEGLGGLPGSEVRLAERLAGARMAGRPVEQLVQEHDGVLGGVLVGGQHGQVLGCLVEHAPGQV